MVHEEPIVKTSKKEPMYKPVSASKLKDFAKIFKDFNLDLMFRTPTIPN